MWFKIKIQIILEVVIWKSKSLWKSNDFKIILKYSLYSRNFDVFCLLTALAIILDCPLHVGQPIQLMLFQFKCFCLNSTKVTQLFRSKWLNFFLSVHREKKLSHFDLKSWVTGGTKIRPNFVVKMTLFSLSLHREKKLSHFDLKSWVTGGLTKFDPTLRSKLLNFFAQCI